MCGVIGIVSRESVSRRLISSAERLQNRGERSVKIVTYDGQYFHASGGLKPPSLQFFDFDHGNLPGYMGIGHTRYATVGQTDALSLDRNIQPVLADRPGMATCNNGDLVNIYSLTRELMTEGFSFQTQVDAKVIQNTLIRHLIGNGGSLPEDYDGLVESLFTGLAKTMNDLIGAYSVLCMLEGGILAFKDPHGIRPLSYAHRKNEDGEIVEWAFASESSVFNYFGDYSGITEVGPGEAVFVSPDRLDAPTIRKIAPKKEAFCFFEFCYFARPDSNFQDRYVEITRQELGDVLAEEFGHVKSEIDVVIGLPGTAVSTGLAFAQRLGLPYRQGVIKVGNKRSFQETSDTKRQKAIDDKFIFIRDFINGQRVAIVDDSNVRGTTSKKIIRRLYSLGAKEVRFFYYTPPIIGPCFYGIDTPDETRLVAFGKSDEEIREEMGCEGVHYLSHDGLIRGLGIGRDRLCLACITRQYPTDVREARERVIRRREERLASEIEPTC
ncbi:MAG: amidophosphoribosyltransferase [Deltaproteobacteria bacterium]|nr:amidophosphoribosyltransferase [Deltaproteobacteria bacterium]